SLRTAATRITVPSPWHAELRKLKAEQFAIDGTRKETEKSHVSPYLLGKIISKELKKQDIFSVDCGFNLTWMVQSYLAKGAEQRFISAWGCSPMGYAIPAAIGAWYARPRATVVCVIGDGGTQMNIQEFQTLAYNKIPVKVFILNNHSYATIRFPTRKEFDGRTFGTEPSTGYAAPDFTAIAKAYGLPVVRLENNEKLALKVKKILKKKGPVIVEVNTDPEQGIIERLKF
ncbi:MAG: thiamine pyrophosphate-dependent enzyme, partial [bacterium]|nr:thiamine pyrophosphate-dependent enzyme [bacterium]